MSEHTPRTEIDLGTIELPESPQMGCRLCHTESHTAYVLCPNHSPARLEAINADLLAALKAAVLKLHKIAYPISVEHTIEFEDCRAPECVQARAAIAKAELPA